MQRLRLISRIAGLAVCAIGALVLAGWVFDVERLRGPIPRLIEMKANTAIGFLLCGSALLLLLDEGAGAGRRRVGRACAALGGMIGAISLVEYVVGANLGIDELLFDDPPESHSDPTLHPGRLAPQTAVGFILIATALMSLQGNERRRQLVWVPAAAAGAIALLALLGYIYSAGEFEAVAAFHPIAPHTALAFIALAVGILCARPDLGLVAMLTGDGAGGMAARRLLPVALVMLPLVGWLGLVGTRAGLYEVNLGVALVVVTVLTFLTIGIVRTVRVLDRAEHARAEGAALRNRLAAIVESSGDAIIGTTADGVVTSWNESAQRLYGYSAEEAIGMPVEALIPAHRRGEEKEILDAVLAGRKIEHFDTERARKDGTVAQVSLTISPISGPHGEVVGASTTAHDISRRKRAEEAIEIAREEAERASRAKSQFLSRMSHELRTPLAGIMGFGQLLEADRLNDRQQESVSQILQGGRHLLDLIKQLLDVSRIEAGEMKLSIEPVDVGRALADVLPLVEPLAGEREVHVKARVQDASGRHVLADADRLRQVLANLLSNGVKYNRRGGMVSVRVKDIEAQDGEARIAIQVADSGFGIEKDKLPLLFTAFERLGREGSDVDGAGLGLMLSKGLVEAMGGELTVKSDPGRGTTFAVELQRAEVRAAAAADSDAFSDETGDEDLDLATIVYIEDNPMNMRLVEKALARYPDVRVLGAARADEGFDLAARCSPDLILLDLHLPDMSGADVLSLLKMDERTREVPVVVLTADATQSPTELIDGGGAYGYMTKPLDIGRFLELVRECVRPREAVER